MTSSKIKGSSPREQWRKEKVIARTDHDHVQMFRVNMLQDGCRAPPGADDGDRLFGRVKGQLFRRVLVLVAFVYSKSGDRRQGQLAPVASQERFSWSR